MFVNILNHEAFNEAKIYKARLESNLQDLKKLTPLLDRFTLLKKILTTIYEYRLKSKEEFISFLQDKNPVIEESRKFEPLKGISNSYVIILDDIIYIYNNFRNPDKYKDPIIKIEALKNRANDETNTDKALILELGNIHRYFDNRLQDQITNLPTLGRFREGGKKKRSIKKKRSKKKRSKKKRR